MDAREYEKHDGARVSVDMTEVVFVEENPREGDTTIVVGSKEVIVKASYETVVGDWKASMKNKPESAASAALAK